MAKFKIGDRVVCTCNYRVVPQGTIGTVVEIRGGRGDSQTYGVRWENFKKGHDLNGLLKGDECKTGWVVEQRDLKLLVEESSSRPETEKPPDDTFETMTWPSKPYRPQHWFTIDESDLDALLDMSFEIKPASECSKPKPQAAASKPKPEPKKETKPKEDGCWKCAAYQQIADCEYGFCSAWHNFAGKDELCTRFKAVDTVDN